MEKNTIYVVTNDIIHRNAICLTIVGLDDRGKFFLPLNESMLDPKNMDCVTNGGIVTNSCLLLPPEYRFKVHKNNNVNNNELPPIYQRQSLRVTFCRWMPLLTSMFGNDLMNIFYRYGSERFILKLDTLFDNRIYLNERSELKALRIGDESISISVPYNKGGIEFDAAGGFENFWP